MFSVNRTTALRPGKPLMAFTTSVVFVGNLDGDIETIVRTSNLFYPMPKEMDTAFYDRIHAYIPGWEFQKTRDDVYTNHFGLVTDYLAEVFKEFRALSENLTERPFLRNFLHPLNREEPTLVTAIRLAG